MMGDAEFHPSLCIQSLGRGKDDDRKKRRTIIPRWIQRQLPETQTILARAQRRPSPTPLDFGWYWNVTDDVAFVTSELIRKGRVFNAWDTPQFQAVEWLTGGRRLRFPPFLDDALHGTFFRILAIDILCREPVLAGDIADAKERVEKATELTALAADELFGMTQEVQDFLHNLPPSVSVSLDNLNRAQSELSFQLGGIIGVFKADLAKRKKFHETLTGKLSSSQSGRPSNWVAEFVAIQAVDIYRTAISGPINRSDESKRPSFRVFLERFAEGIPDAMRADTRRLARSIWGKGYKGTPFAPVSD